MIFMKLLRQMRPASTRHFYKAVLEESGERVALALMKEEVERIGARPASASSAGCDSSACGCDDPAAGGRLRA